MSDETFDVEGALKGALSTALPPPGSYFPVVGNSPRDAHGRLEDVQHIVLRSDPPIDLYELRSEFDNRERCDVSVPSNFYDWLHENLGVSATLPGLFRRNDQLIRVPRIGEEGWIPPRPNMGDDGPAQIRPLSGLGLLDIIQHRFWVYKEKRDVKSDADSSTGEREIITRTHAMVPFDIARLPVDSPGEWRTLPNVTGVTHTPMMRRDGSLLEKPGYDPESELLYLPDEGFEILDHPAAGRVPQGWVDWSVKVLNDLVEDFPFEHELHKMNYFALLLTPLMRAVCPPPYPMWVINAHQRGTGKSLLAKVAREFHGGVHRPELPTDSEEIRKQITSILTTTTAPIVNFDNITSEIKNGQIANLLTTATWSDRPLGRTATVEAANDRLWVCTGNNVRIGGDLARRVRTVFLDAAMTDPEYRTKFKHNDLIGYVKQTRGTLITALLTQIMWWVQQGMPVKDIRSDDYARWEGSLAALLEGGGLDPTGAFAGGERAIGGLTESSDEDELSDLLQVLTDHFGGRQFQIRDIKELYLGLTTQELVREVIPVECQSRVSLEGNYEAVFRNLGMYLGRRDRQGVGGLRLAIRGKGRGGNIYQLETVKTAREVEDTKEK